jgi:hexosaminidase
VLNQSFNINKATVKPVKYANLYSDSYKGSGEYTLVNGVHGTTNHADGEWQGWEGKNMDVVIDLQQQTDVSKITTSALQNSGAWIFFPKKVEFFVSADGAKFQKVGEVVTDVDPLSKDKQVKEYSISFAPVKAGFVKVVATSLDKAPKGHQGAGDNAWLFIDEIAVE